jgi:hypothetical protein
MAGIRRRTVERILKHFDKLEVDFENGKILNKKEYTDEKGYKYILLDSVKIRVHVALMVLAGYDVVGKVINHKNGDKHDNRIENLEIITQKENVLHARKHGFLKSKLTESDVREIRKLLKMGVKPSKIAKEYGVSNLTIYNIRDGKTWKWLDSEDNSESSD